MTSTANVGDIIAGKYQIERVIGTGGMGVVVAARHLHLGERVAIKFLLPQALERAEVVQRFLREGRAAARIRSEHVARVFDVGVMDDGKSPFLVMEYLDGQDLGALLRNKGQLDVETAVGYVMQACEALAEAHAMGIVHRDLKPGNLFLTSRMDGSPQIKIIDFGISKVIGGGEGDGEMTATAVMMGSPLYMAPEQMASARDVDARADIWSLGVILHALLTGGPPFKATSVMQVYELVLRGAPPIRTIRPEVPEAIEKSILRCLQKEQARRFQTIADFADAIGPFGPDGSQLSVARISRVIRGPGKPATAPAAAPTPSSTPPPAMGVTPPTPAPTKMPSAALEPATGGSWGQTHAPGRRRSRVPLIAGAILVSGVLIGGAMAIMSHRQATTADPDTKNAAPGQSEAPAGSAAIAPPIAEEPPSATQPAIAVPPPPVTASATAAPSASAPSKKHLPQKGPTPKPDLFGDPH